MDKNIVITTKISVTLYKGHLPIGWGHLEPEGGRTWLGVAIAEGYTRQGNGDIILKALCEYADSGGWELWLTSHASWMEKWYGKFGFNVVEKTGKCTYLKRERISQERNR